MVRWASHRHRTPPNDAKYRSARLGLDRRRRRRRGLLQGQDRREENAKNLPRRPWHDLQLGMLDLCLIPQPDPFAPSAMRYLVCAFSAAPAKRNYFVLSNHATRASAVMWMNEYRAARDDRWSRDSEVQQRTQHVEPQHAPLARPNKPGRLRHARAISLVS